MVAGGQIGALRISLGLNSADFTQGMQNVNRRLTALNSEFKAITSGAARFDNSLETLRAKSDVLTRSMTTHRAKVEELRRQYEHSKATKGEDAAETVRLATAYNRAVTAMNKTEQQLRQVNAQIQQQSSGFNRLETEVNTSVDSISRQMRVLDSRFDAATASVENFGNSTAQLRQKEQHLNQSLELHQRRVEELTRLHQEAIRVKGADARETQEVEIRLNRATQAMRETERQLNNTTQEIREQSNAWLILSNRSASIGNSLVSAGASMRSVGQNLMTHVTLPIVALGGAALKAGADFEEGMDRVAAISGASGEELRSLTAQAEDLGAKTKFSATEAASGMEFLAMAGFKTNDILKAMPGMLNLAAAGALELGASADITSNIMSGFGISAEQAGHVADVLAKAASSANTDVSQLGEAMKYLAPAASSLGWSMEEATAAVMAMSDAGIQGSLAGQAFGTSLTRLAKNPSNQVKKALKDLKFSFFDANGQMKSMPEIIAGIEKGTAKMTDKQKAATLTTIFGAEAYKQWAVLLEKGSKTLGENVKMLENADGAAEKMAKTMADNTKGNMKTFMSALENLSIQLSRTLLPIANDVIDKLTEWARKFAEMDQSTQKTILAFAGVAAAAGPVIMGLGSMTSGVGFLLKGIAPLTAAIGSSAGLSATLSAVAGPAGLAALAIGGITAVAISAKNSLEKAKEVNLEHAESLIVQQKELESLSDKFQLLHDKNRLSTDELLRFRDIQSDLKFAKSAEEIKALTDEQAKLLEKSGLTNDEMNTMLQLNDDLIKLVPDVDKALSDHGNAMIDNAGAIDEANKKLKENIALELENQRIKAEAKLEENIRNYITALDELNAKEKERNQAVKEREESEVRLAGLKIEAQKQLNEGKDREAEKTINEIAKTEILLAKQNDKIANLADEVTEKQKSVEQTQKEIEKTQTLYDKMIDLHLEQVGINEKGAVGLKQLDDAIKKTQTRINELNKLKGQQGGLNEAQSTELANLQTSLGQYRSKKEEIQRIQNEQSSVNRRIDEGTGKAKQMTNELGKNVKKNVDIDDKGKAKNLNEEVSKAVTKRVTLNATWTGISKALKAVLPFFAKGTKNAPGGPSVVGEAGRELVHAKGGLYLASGPSLVNLPKGAKVIPNHDTEAILRKWNVPMMATGGVTLTDGMAYVAERGRELIDLRGAKRAPIPNQNNSTSFTIQPAPIYLDGLLVGQVDFDLVEDGLNTRFTNRAIVNGVNP